MCLLMCHVFWVKFLAIYFTANSLSPQETKERARKETSARCFHVNFEEFLRTPFLRTITVAASEDEHDETKLLHMTSQLNKYL